MKLDISINEHWVQKKKDITNKINISKLPLILFGCADFKSISNFISSLTVPIDFICDNDIEKQGNIMYDYKIISPNEISKYYTKYNVLILVPFEKEITAQLQNLEYSPEQIFYLDMYFETEDIPYFVDKNKDKFKYVHQHLADDKSKQVYQSIVSYWLERDPSVLFPLSEPRNTQYFPKDIFSLNSEEVFVDAGAFTGDTIQEFLRENDGKYQFIYAFEPDKFNFAKLSNTVSKLENIKCFQAGVSNKNKTANFVSDSSSSKLSESGTDTISLVSLDNTLPEVNITYLKMDIEGAECAALLGAEKLIKRSKPKLAICMYHSIQDMLNIPLSILELDPSYKLYIRHYTNAIVETVCYAIP